LKATDQADEQDGQKDRRPERRARRGDDDEVEGRITANITQKLKFVPTTASGGNPGNFTCLTRFAWPSNRSRTGAALEEDPDEQPLRMKSG
jgi:hypothetical protein